MLLSNEKYAKENVYWTLDFVLSANYYIYQCAAKQVEILAANIKYLWMLFEKRKRVIH